MAPVSLYLPFSFLGSSTHSLRAMVDFLPSSSSLSSTLTPVSSAKKAWFRRSLMENLRDERTQAHTNSSFGGAQEGHYNPNDAQHTESSTVSQPNSGADVTQREQQQKTRAGSEGNLWLHNNMCRQSPHTSPPTGGRYIRRWSPWFLGRWLYCNWPVSLPAKQTAKPQRPWLKSNNSSWNELMHFLMSHQHN